MPERPRRKEVMRRALAWSIGWTLAGGLYLVLIDTTSLPELIAGAGAAAIAATGLELAREQHIVGERIRLAWLRPVYRPIVRVPADIALVSMVAMRQLFDRRQTRGRFRVARFSAGEQTELDTGREALAESFGSFAPNTIVIGVDSERELILAHQLQPRGGRDAIDVMDLG